MALFSVVGVHSEPLLAGVSQLLVGVARAVLLDVDGSSVEVASSESHSLGGGVVVVWELRDSAELSRGVLLDDSVMRGLVLISLQVEAVGLWKGGWLSAVSRVIVVPCGMSSEEVFSRSLWGIIFKFSVVDSVLLCSWGGSRSSSFFCWLLSWLCYWLFSLSSLLSSFISSSLLFGSPLLLFSNSLSGLCGCFSGSFLCGWCCLSSNNHSQSRDK